MNTTQTQKGENLLSIQITLAKADYEPKVNEELKKLSHKVSIPGFRSGKVPFGMVKKMYGTQATIEALNSLVSETLNNYIFDNKLDLLGYPLNDPDHQEPLDFENQDTLDFFFEAALRPEIHVDYTKAPVDFKHIVADEKALNETIENVLQRNPIITNPENVGENDTIELKVREAEDGKEIEGGFQREYVMLDLNKVTDEESKKALIGKVVGEEFIFNFATALGSEDEVTKLLGKDAPADSDYNIIIDNVKHEEPAVLNEEFFEKMFPGKDVKDEATFRAHVKEEMEKQYTAEADHILFTKMIDNLVDNTPFALPDSFLKRWMADQGKISAEEVEKGYEETYSKGMRWQLIEDSIVKDNMDLAIKDEEVKEFLRGQIFPGMDYNTMEESMKASIDKIVENYLKNEEQVMNVKNQLADIKMTNFLKTKMTINYTDATYEEFIEELKNEKN